MPDLHGWITQQITEREQLARDATEGPWCAEHPEGRWGDGPEARLIGGGKTLATFSNDYNGHLNADHAALNSPAAVLRRCAADRKILAEHRPMGGGYPSHYACYGCGFDSYYCPEPYTEHTNDCPTLLALAEGYGLTEEQRATLDRPEKERPEPTGPSLIPPAVAESLYGNLLRMVLETETRPFEPRLHVVDATPPGATPQWFTSPGERAFAVVEPHLSALALYKPDTEEPTP